MGEKPKVSRKEVMDHLIDYMITTDQLTDERFAETAYKCILKRLCNEEEMEHTLQLLQQGTSKSDIIKMLQETEEALKVYEEG